MAIRIPDLVILNTLIAGENMLLGDLDKWLPIIFAGRSESERSILANFLRRGVQADNPEDAAKYGIKKFLGYPSTPKELPCLAVTIAHESETTQAIGQAVEDATQDMRDDPTRNWIEYGALFEGTFSIDCYSLNPDLTAYLQAIVKFILLYYRGTLHDQYGLIKQRLTCGDLRTDPEAIPGLGFVRQVQLSCTWVNSWVETVEPLAGIEHQPTWLTRFGQTLI